MFHLVRPPLLILPLAILLSGCKSLSPQPFTAEQTRARASGDLGKLTKDQEPVRGPISLYEAMARAMKYNLDFRLELMEKALAQRELNLSHYNLLPDLVGHMSYYERDNFSGASSRSLIFPFGQSLQSSTSQDRGFFAGDLTLSYSVLDFGLSYIRAQQNADKVLIAEERKRKAINRIAQDVRTAYWRAVSAERLRDEMRALAQRIERALAQSQSVREQRLESPLTALTYQRELLAIQRELQTLQRDLMLAKIQLAALMNLKPGEDYQLAVPERMQRVPELTIDPAKAGQLALENRPEVRELAYEGRINEKESKAAVLRLLPNLRLEGGYNYNDNSFLFNPDWLSGGAQVAWNLMNAFKLPATFKTVKAKQDVVETQRQALSMAVLTQVYVSMAQYGNSRREYSTSMDYLGTQTRILGQVKSSKLANRISEQALIREEMNNLVAEVRHDISYADLQNNYAGVYAAVGQDPLPAEDVQKKNVQQLKQSLESYWASR
jgi:outer membrane protein TolC